MDRRTITLDLSGDQIEETIAALRRAAALPTTSVFDHISLLEIAGQLDAANAETSEPVEVEFTPRGEQGAA